MIQWHVGVDEAGRGPLAGPVAVGVACVPIGFVWDDFIKVKDSKVMTEKARERVFLEAEAAREARRLNFHVALVSAEVIDTKGISHAVRQGIAECFAALALSPEETEVKLDGLLHAPKAFLNQETIICGDALEPAISLASIVAKVTRDRHMIAIHEQFPEYNFAKHKGYGTAAHYAAIREHGMCAEHRETFIH
jgi:ribonuclease HII